MAKSDQVVGSVDDALGIRPARTERAWYGTFAQSGRTSVGGSYRQRTQRGSSFSSGGMLSGRTDRLVGRPSYLVLRSLTGASWPAILTSGLSVPREWFCFTELRADVWQRRPGGVQGE